MLLWYVTVKYQGFTAVGNCHFRSYLGTRVICRGNGESGICHDLQYNHWKYRCSRGKWRGSPFVPEFLEIHKGKYEKGHKFSFLFKINVKKM